MAQVVLLKGVNVGGHRILRPSVLAKSLRRFDVVNVGAAGTFVVRKRVGGAHLRAAMVRRLSFKAEVIICSGHDFLRVASADPFAGEPSGPHLVRFVTVLAKAARPSVPIPLNLPSDDGWELRILAHERRFVFGMYRRHMKAIRYLGQLETIFGVPATTRNWNTIVAIVQILKRAG